MEQSHFRVYYTPFWWQRWLAGEFNLIIFRRKENKVNNYIVSLAVELVYLIESNLLC